MAFLPVLLLPVLLLLAVSCAHVPERPDGAGVPFPETWTAATGDAAVIGDEWWVRLGDSNLVHLVAEALTNNYDLQAAAARVASAQAQARIAGADLYPTLGAGFEASRSQRNYIGLPIPGFGDKPVSSLNNAFGLNLTTTWELDLWGRLRSGQRAARSIAEAAEFDFSASRLSLTGQTVKAWLAVLEAREQLRLTESTLANLEATAAQIRARYERGLRSALDLRLAQATVDNGQALVVARQVVLEQTVRQLEILLGRYPAGRLPTEAGFPEMPETIPAGLPSELLARRPDLQASARRLVAADWRVAESKAALLPRLSLTASGGTSTEELADLVDPDFKVWNLGANLAQPIFQGGRLRAGVDFSKARVREALAAHQSAVLQAFSEVESALVSESLLTRREVELTEAVAQSDGALRLAQNRYRFGLDNFITVLESQRRLYEAETQLVSVRRQRLDNRVHLHLALGGGFPEADPVQARREAGRSTLPEIPEPASAADKGS